MTATTTITSKIPSSLIYEMDDGRPIYYKGYKEVLDGTKSIHEIMSDSTLQAWLKGKIFKFLEFGPAYDSTVGEQGLQFGKNSWRAVDIAIFKTENLILNNKYSSKAPEVVIEIDTKADFKNLGEAIEYYDNKIEKLLDFGVQQIIWIFTDSKKITIIDANNRRKVVDWATDVSILDTTLNLVALFEKYQRDLPE